MVEGDQAAEDGFLPYGESHAVPVLQGERGRLVWETELLGPRPDRDDVRRRGTGLDQGDRMIHVFAAACVRIALGHRRAADGERAVVAGAIAQMAVEDVEEGRVAGPDEPVAVDVRVRRAPFAGDGVDALDVLAAEVVEGLADHADALVLLHPGPQELVQVLVGGVDHRAGLGQQGDLVGCLDAARLEEDLLAVDDGESFRLQRGQDGHLDDVDA